MPVAHALQDLVADVSAAIAENATWTRPELEVWRRKLAAVVQDVREDGRADFGRAAALIELAEGVDRHVADLGGLARRARVALQEAA